MAAPVELEGVVAGRADLPGGRCLLTVAAGELARLAAPGQFAMIRCGSGHDPYLRRALPFLRLAGGTVSFLFTAGDPGLDWLGRRRLGDRMSLLGPLGNGFALEPNTRRLLLAAVAGPTAPLLALADAALAREVSVSLAVSDAAARDLAAIIPGAVELLAAPQEGEAAPGGALWGLDPEALAWADQVALSGPLEEVLRLAGLIALLRPGFAQCYVERPVACGLGWCGSCLTETRRGPRRACTGGPVFDLRELA